MRIRLIALAVVAVIAVTAFAPAPFTKTDRKRGRGGDVLAALQGTWAITEKTRMGPNGALTKYSTTTQKVQIEDGVWRYVSANEGKIKVKGGAGKGGAFARPSYKMVLDHKRLPVEFRLKRTTSSAETDYMVGIIHVNGNTARVLYRLGSGFGRQQEAMPTSFDNVPEGWYSMTLSRDR